MTTPTPLPAPVLPGAGRQPLPAGATKWALAWLDERGIPQRTDYLVPVDASERRTPHIRHTCRGHIEVGGKKLPCDQVAWLNAGQSRFCPDHGAELTPDAHQRDPLVPWGKVWRAVEPAARPLWALCTTVSITAGMYAGHVPAWVPAAVTPLLAAGGYAAVNGFLVRRAIRNGRMEKRERGGRRRATYARRARTAAYTAAGAGAWATAATATSPHGPGVAVWWSSLLLLTGAAPWWRYLAELRGRPAPAVELPPDLAGPSAEALQDAANWATTVAPAGMQGTIVDLATWVVDAGGRRMVIRNVARKTALTEEKFRQALSAIMSAFDLPRSAIGWVEGYEGSPNAALLLIQPNSPLNNAVPWKPIDILDVNNAVAPIGTRIDGSDLTTRLWTPGWGAPSRLIIGTKGSGKTEYLRLLLLIMLKAHIQSAAGPIRLYAPFLHDPKRGKDFGAFRRLVCGFSTRPETLHMIVDAIIREMDRRYDSLADTTWVDAHGREREGEQPFDPATMGPIIGLYIDEFHEPAKDPELVKKLEPAARKQRAAAIEFVLATHMATIGDTGSQGLRDMIGGGEATLFRTTLGLNASLATGGQLIGDPRALPRVPGMNLHASGEEATMQARMAYLPSEDLYNELYDLDNRTLIQPIVWPQATLDAFGTEFVEWMIACQERPVGSPAPAIPQAAFVAATIREELKAIDALLRILGSAIGPLRRADIIAHPLWGTRAVKTLSTALRGAQDASPSLIRKLPDSNGAYQLTPDGKAAVAWADDLDADLAELEAETQPAT